MRAVRTARYRDRRHAGEVLAAACGAYRGRADVLVLALPRGGVPVGYEVARALGAALDVFLVRKLGVPGHEELAMGAVASNGVRVLNDGVVRAYGVQPALVEQIAEAQDRELRRRESLYRGGRPAPLVADRTVLLVDDGLATGATMKAAVMSVRQLLPARVAVAVPAAPHSTCRELRTLADEVVCEHSPEPFLSVGSAYADFTQTSDAEVLALLDR